MLDLKSKTILLTGGSGFLGKNIVKILEKKRVKDIRIPRSKTQDLRQWENCVKAVKGANVVIHAAGNVGGIGYNQKFPGELFYDNLIMGAQLMEAARQANVLKFTAIGTICAYPKNTKVPFKEKDLWAGYPEETNAPYGIAKKMLLVQGQSYRLQYGMNVIYLLPVNLYGPGDKFDPQSSHVIPALIRKFIEAKGKHKPSVTVWGTGKATREFLYVEDAAEAIVAATERYDEPDPVNIGAGFEISIGDLAKLIARLVGYKGKITFDPSKPDGQPRRLLDISRAYRKFNFKASTDFESGMNKTIAWYLKQIGRNLAFSPRRTIPF